MGVFLRESHDDVAQVGEGLVDGLGLGQPHPLAPGVLDSLRAGQIHQVEGTAAGLAGLEVDSLDLEHEDAVTATGPLIAESLGPGSVLPRLLDDCFDLVLSKDLLFPEVGHVDVSALGIAHLDLVLEAGVIL